MNPSPNIAKQVSPLRLTLIVILLVSVLYPLFFAYIDRIASVTLIAREVLFTAARLTVIALLIQASLQLTNRIANVLPAVLRHLLSLALTGFAAYWFLYAFVAFIEVPFFKTTPADPSVWAFRRYIGLYLLATLFVYTFLSALNIYQVARQKEAQAEHLQREFAQVRLQALKSQVNPHFLFNSLSVLSSLVHVDAERSEQFIHRLAKAYRYILEQKELELVTLREELGFLDAYFFLLQTRFDSKIKLEKNIPFSAEDRQLPPLSLQLLVENAVKHNRMSAAEPLVIKLFVEGESLVVENNRQEREQAETSTGVGLANIKKRYAMLSERKPVVAANDKTFRVELPLIKRTS